MPKNFDAVKLEDFLPAEMFTQGYCRLPAWSAPGSARSAARGQAPATAAQLERAPSPRHGRRRPLLSGLISGIGRNALSLLVSRRSRPRWTPTSPPRRGRRRPTTHAFFLFQAPEKTRQNADGRPSPTTTGKGRAFKPDSSGSSRGMTKGEGGVICVPCSTGRPDTSDIKASRPARRFKLDSSGLRRP
jgi:hypothetical protein